MTGIVINDLNKRIVLLDRSKKIELPKGNWEYLGRYGDLQDNMFLDVAESNYIPHLGSTQYRFYGFIDDDYSNFGTDYVLESPLLSFMTYVNHKKLIGDMNIGEFCIFKQITNG